MTTDPLTDIRTRHVPQSEPARVDQVKNTAGGFVFAIDDLARLRRFLTLGTDGGTYYVSERELTKDNAQVVIDLAQSNPRALVDEIVAISTAGRAPRQQPALFALAIAASLADVEGRAYALAALPLVVRIGTHLFQFVTYVEQFRGWGPALRRAVGQWYSGQTAEKLGYQVVKYRQRGGWTHRDVLRLAHPAAPGLTHAFIYDWVCGRTDVAPYPHIRGFQKAQTAHPGDVPALIAEYGLSWEMLPDAALNEPATWEALLDRGLPQTALLRQLPRLTKLGLLDPMGARTAAVAAQLCDPERLRKARVHPISVLLALRTYAAGQGARGRGEWTPSRPIVDALDAAFYAAFGAVQPSGKRMMLALDVSGSMTQAVSGLPLTCREASAALALVTASTERQYGIVGFTSASGRRWDMSGAALTPLAISPRQRLDDAIRAVSNLPFGGTDCALPMLHAMQRGLAVDTFVIFTDSETWAGTVHPYQALRDYRQHSGIDAKLVVVAMTPTEFSIADPSDAGMIDVAGFDASVPNLISDFARGL